MERFSKRIRKISASRKPSIILAIFLAGFAAILLMSSQMAFSESWFRPFSNAEFPMGFGDGPRGRNSGHGNRDDYVVIGWNDLGMHCINSSYSQLAILPPFNNLWAQVIKRGDPPKVVTSGISLEYSILNNTTAAGKTDFWDYADQLFGVKLRPGIGLTGNGLSGKMKPVGDHFEATGIPVLPYDDQMNWNPYQTAIIKMKDSRGRLLEKIQVTLPVSDEINCAQCHMQGMDGTVNLPVDEMTSLTGTMDVNLNILMVHDFYNGTPGQKLVDVQPVLCAKCHSSNALGAPGLAGVKSVSLAMHGWHNGVDRAGDATCYSCHPGEATQCLRTGIAGMGYLGKDPSCQTGLCHGGIEGMGDPTRNPWVTEPSCDQCHGSNYSTGQNLYRHAKGDVNVPCSTIYCVACHNSPHAWWPSKLWADNFQPIMLQRVPYALRNCSVCHTKKMVGDNPHVIYYLPAKDPR